MLSVVSGFVVVVVLAVKIDDFWVVEFDGSGSVVGEAGENYFVKIRVGFFLAVVVDEIFAKAGG